MIDWILMHPYDAAGVIAVILAAAIAGVAGWKLGGLRQGLLQLMLHLDRARRQGRLGPIDGPQIMVMVVNLAMTRLVPQMPSWLRPMITPERLQAWAQALFDAGLDYLDDGILNGTHPTLPDNETGSANSGSPPRSA